jgi:DNA-binding XRE family transcriptional regulator
MSDSLGYSLPIVKDISSRDSGMGQAILPNMGKVADLPIAAHAREEVGARLRAYRKHLALSQGDFANKILGVERDRYAKYEQGLYEMPYFLLKRLADQSHKSIHWWITGHDSPASKGPITALKVIHR